MSLQSELDAFRAAWEGRVGADIAALVAADNALDTAEKNQLGFTVLSDSGGLLADALGIRFALSPAVKALYQRFGHDLPVHKGDGAWSLPMPASFVVARGERIALAEVDPDHRRRMEPESAIAALGALAWEAV